MTSDRKRKWSDVDDDCRCESCGDGARCEKSTDAGGRPSAVAMPTVVMATPSSDAADLRATRSSSAAPPAGDDRDPRPHVRDNGRPPTDDVQCSDGDERLSCVPLGVVNVWHKNWSSVGAPRLLVEPSLCRESLLPVLLLNGSSCCQLSN